MGALSVASGTLIAASLQLAASDELRGRVMGVYFMGTLGVRSFNGPLIGVFASAAGAPLALAILGVVVVAAVLATTITSPAGRQLD